MRTFQMSHGPIIPAVGFGTAPLKGEEAYQAVLEALKAGYRHIDTAAIYMNEEMVGQAIRDSRLDRETLFITSKLDASIKSYQGAIDAYEASLKRLKLETLDLFLIHAPWPWDQKYSEHDAGNVAAFNGLIDLYKSGRVRAIGVSNFELQDLKNLQKHCEMLPHVNQIKCHIGHFPEELIRYCHAHDIVVQAYSPLGRGHILDHALIHEMAKKYDVTPAQICLRYPLEKNVLPLPRSSKTQNIKTNLALDFVLDQADVKKLDSLTIESIEFGTPIKK